MWLPLGMIIGEVLLHWFSLEKELHIQNLHSRSLREAPQICGQRHQKQLAVAVFFAREVPWPEVDHHPALLRLNDYLNGHLTQLASLLQMTRQPHPHFLLEHCHQLGIDARIFNRGPIF